MSRPHRVCFLIDRLRAAGTERQLLTMIDRFDRSRIDPILCLLDGDDGISRSLEPKQCVVRRLGIKSLHSASTFNKAIRFAQFLRSARVDVLKVHFPDSTYFGVPLARLGGVPNILCTCNDLGYWVDYRHRVLGSICSYLSHGTIANCMAAKDTAISLNRSAARRVTVLPNGVDCDKFAMIPSLVQQLPRHDGTSTVGIVANLRPVKNLQLFVRAAASVASRYPHVRFVIAGEGEQRADLERLIIALGLSDRVTLEGQVADMPAFLARLDVAVLCSDSEGFSNALLEYMAAGRPIVATSVGGNREVITDGVNGLLVPAANPSALSAAIGQLLASPSLACEMGDAARRFVRDHYSFDVSARRLEEFFCSLQQRL